MPRAAFLPEREGSGRARSSRAPWIGPTALGRALLVRLHPRLALRILSPRDPCFALAGERLVERALRARGWRFVARRLETRWAELDLVFAEGATLVVIEVKTGRAGPRFGPGMRLGRETLERLWRAADALARGQPRRVDLIEVELDQRRRANLVHHAGILRPL